MEVSYRNGFWDIVWFNFYLLTHTLRYQIVYGLLFLGFGYFYFNGLVDDKLPFLIKVLAFILTIIQLAVLFAGFIFAISGFSYIANQTQRQQLKQDRKLSVADNGVIAEWAIGRSEIKWPGIKKIRQTHNYILFNITERQGWIIPKRAFADRADAEKFFTYSYQLWEKGKNTNTLQ